MPFLDLSSEVLHLCWALSSLLAKSMGAAWSSNPNSLLPLVECLEEWACVTFPQIGLEDGQDCL